jgi:hypothetical protein
MADLAEIAVSKPVAGVLLLLPGLNPAGKAIDFPGLKFCSRN